MSSLLTLRHVRKQFGDFVAVNDVSFDVPAGSFFAFLGPNGAGKTTTIKMILGLSVPTAGTIEFHQNGKPLHVDEFRRDIGTIFQDITLDDQLQADENLLLHAMAFGMKRDEYQEREDEILSFVELKDHKNSLVRTFSGGMKRRLEIARALLHRPKILFLDEPTVGLDPQSRNRFWEFVQRERERSGLTIFLTTHYLEEAEPADDVAIIHHGSIIAHASPAELKKTYQAKSLNDVFLQLTGTGIVNEEATGIGEFFRNNQRFMR